MQEKSQDNVQTKKATRKYGKRAIIVLIFIIGFLLFNFISLRGEYLEILEIGEEYVPIFWTNLKYRCITTLVNFVILFLSIYITNRTIKKGLNKFFDEEKKDMPKLPNKSIALIAGILISIVTSGIILEKVFLYFNSTYFGITDLIFNNDISYYIMQKPFIEMIIIYIISLVIGLSIYTAIYYITIFNVHFDGISRETLKKSTFLKQIFVNVMIIVISVAALTLVKTQDIVNDRFLNISSELKLDLYGAGLTDVTIKLWGYRILSLVMIISTYMAIRYIKKGNTKKVIAAILVVPGYLCVLFIIMATFQIVFVKSNELDKQNQYISYNIDSTKNGYNINIEEIEVANSGTITLDEANRNKEVLDNIPVVDINATLKTLEEYQTNSNYYTFSNSSINNYKIDENNTLIYITPREIMNSPDRTYNNKTYEYTHGYGVIMSSASQVNESGGITYIQKDFDSKDQKIQITEPRIYFGLETNDTIITNHKNKLEYDYPITTLENAEYAYTGLAGLQLNFIDRLVLGLKSKNLKLAFSNDITSNSKIIMNRNVRERAKKLLPYLLYDEDPYLVINDEGKLIWVLDAYSIANEYPYSQKSFIEYEGNKKQINYIRNSVKVLVDAFNGDITFYITDRSDPIVMAYRDIYPSLFADKDQDIPEDISKHIKYPKYLYNIQSEMLKMYHNVQNDVLYRCDDIWDSSTHVVGKNLTTVGTKIEPYYTMVKTVDSEQAKFGLVLPYTPFKKQNINAYLVGVYDKEEKNKLVLYRFVSDNNVLGPMQLDTQIEQDTTISRELDSLNVTGTKIVRNMIVVPIENTLLYIEPIYQVMLNETNVPVLKKVIVASGNKVAIGNTLKQGLENLLSQYAVDIEVENTDDLNDLIQAIIKANNNLEGSNANSDWEMMGKDIKKLQDLINKLEILIKEESTNNTINNNNILDSFFNTIE